MDSPKSILLKILDIIEYKDDKEVFSDKFFNVIAQQTVGDLIFTLPPEKKTIVEARMKEEQDAARLKEIFHATFTEKEINAMMERVTHRAFQDYTKAILPVLTAQQKQKLQELVNLTSLQK